MECGRWHKLLVGPEQALYFQFLEMAGFTRFCLFLLSGVMVFLDLEKSVWQASANYRQCREYDADHFLVGSRNSENGIFCRNSIVSTYVPLGCRHELRVSSSFIKRFKSGCRNGSG